MSSNFTSARDQFRTFSARPGMFVIDSYDDIASFIAGMDYAHNHELLAGFEDWVQNRLGARSSLCWSEYVKDRFELLSSEEKRKFGEDRKRFLFSHIEQFFLEKDAKRS